MIVIPAVDIMDGRCVQLVQGKPDSKKDFGDPVEVSKNWERRGAKVLHVIDLDAALGSGDNLSTVLCIRSSVKVPIQFGGGVRSIERAKKILDSGIDRAIIGTMAAKNPEAVKKLSKEYGKHRIMVAVDSRGGEIVIKGWTEGSGIKTEDLITELKDYVFGFLVTDVDREGLMVGIDVEEFARLYKTGARICASGGITTLDDVRALEKIGVWGCVVGKALYEGRISLRF
jgi:phosphoribosylformimino-5-aminoimidazole carboxamide ribotide isomerase